MRIDRLLCYLRFFRTRSLSHALVDQGHIRCNGVRVARASQTVKEGDVLTFPLGEAVKIIEISALPARRGPASEAQMCYRVLDPRGETAIAPNSTDHD